MKTNLVTKPLIWLLALAALSAGGLYAEAKVETGEINSAKFRIDMPANFNGGLVMYCHGYSGVAVGYDNPKPNPFLDVFLNQGYAVAQSGYAAGGWAIQEAVQDTEALRRYFVKKYGAAKETYITGHSMGGFLTMMLVERYPNVYDGGLALCGPLAPTNWFMKRGAFDLRVVFDYYFPGALPSPVKIPVDYKNTPSQTAEIQALLDSKPTQAEEVRRWAGLHNNKDLASGLTFGTYVLKDLEQRGGGNPFDNRSTVYEGVSDYNALNDGVKRYTPDARAAEYLRTYYTPTGRLLRPLLAIHTTYDPVVPAWIPNFYSSLAEQAGNAGLFVQHYVKHDGHCAIRPEEVSSGFAELRQWKESGTRSIAAGQ